MMKLLPKARTVEIVERDLDKELLIYDLTTHKAYTLNETSKIVFKACDGRKTFDELKEKHRFTDELIHLALGELQQNALLNEDYVSPFAGINRREIIKKVGLATMIALPVILALTAPQASHAASNRVDNCGPLNVCRLRNTVFCPPGCTATITIVFFTGGGNGNCSGSSYSSTENCAIGQGSISVFDYTRIA